MAIPDFRTRDRHRHRGTRRGAVSPAGDERAWSARFGRELNATDDRAHFCAPGTGLPVIEGKHIEPFRVATARARAGIARAKARRLLDPSRYERPRLAYRTSPVPTNRLTLIAAVLPAHCVSTHTVFCLRTPLPLQSQYFLCGLFNSFVVNYLVRMRVDDTCHDGDRRATAASYTRSLAAARSARSRRSRAFCPGATTAASATRLQVLCCEPLPADARTSSRTC